MGWTTFLTAVVVVVGVGADVDEEEAGRGRAGLAFRADWRAAKVVGGVALGLGFVGKMEAVGSGLVAGVEEGAGGGEREGFDVGAEGVGVVVETGDEGEGEG